MNAPLPVAATGAADPTGVRGPLCGLGKLRVAVVEGASAVVAAEATAPLHLLLPRPRGVAVWAVPTTLGGGLVSGDRIGMDLDCGAGATLCMITQASTKIYKSDGMWCASTVEARIGEAALLALLPDPVTPFSGALFRQDQAFSVAEGGSLVVIDAVTCGRAARGERYEWAGYRSRLKISVGGRPWVHDALRLEPPHLAARMGRFAALATVVAVGPRAAGAVEALLAAAAGGSMDPAKSGAALRVSASPLPGGVIVRAAATDAGTLAGCIRSSLGTVLASPLGEDPWARRG